MSDIEQTLKERGARYGSFFSNAAIAQRLKADMHVAGWFTLAVDQQEALEVIASKISRILTGDPNYADSWHDIAGYAMLVENRLNEDQHKQKEGTIDQ